MRKVGFLVSGNGGTLMFIHSIIKKLALPIEISFVIADRECGAIEFARNNGIVNHLIRYNTNSIEELDQLIDLHADTDLIVTNIHKILDAQLLNKHKGKFVNLHYSLLPAYSGLIGMKTVEYAKADNAMFIGATCHEVTEVLDGGRILCQSCFPVNWDNEFSEICNKVFISANNCLLNSLLKKLEIVPINSYSKIGDVFYNPSLVFDA